MLAQFQPNFVMCVDGARTKDASTLFPSYFFRTFRTARKCKEGGPVFVLHRCSVCGRRSCCALWLRAPEMGWEGADVVRLTGEESRKERKGRIDKEINNWWERLMDVLGIFLPLVRHLLFKCWNVFFWRMVIDASSLKKSFAVLTFILN